MLVAIVESEMEEGMDDVAVHSEHSWLMNVVSVALFGVIIRCRIVVSGILVIILL